MFRLINQYQYHGKNTIRFMSTQVRWSESSERLLATAYYSGLMCCGGATIGLVGGLGMGVVSPKTFDQFISPHVDSSYYKPNNPLAYMLYGGAIGFLLPGLVIYNGFAKLQSICNPDL